MTLQAATNTLVIEPENMLVHITSQEDPKNVVSYFIPDFLLINSDEKLKTKILNEVSLYASRFF
jgi:hypothetical protein